MDIRVAGIVNDSIVDGPGLRLAVFTQGCRHNCKGCHNPETHDINGGYLIRIDEILLMADKNPLLSGITLSGGEPFLQPEPCKELAMSAKKRGLNVIAYTGFLWEELMVDGALTSLLSEIDYIVDGRFIEELRTLDMTFAGSSNQRIINVRESLRLNETVIHKFD